MDSRTDPLGITLATYVYLMHRHGQIVVDPTVARACQALDGGGEVTVLAHSLRVAIRSLLPGDETEDLIRGLERIFGDGIPLAFGEGSNNQERSSALRRASFGDSRPWLAWIVERREGALAEVLVMVARFAEEVLLLDPNPWDDVPEAQVYSATEFMVRWELAGARAIRLL